ncbi:MAG: glycosyl transferase [Bacteroidaceae bacterium]|nr:glycosyl transferase [Bacteroidaceae bacterium]
MNVKDKLYKAIRHPEWILGVILRRCFSRMMNDRNFIRWEYFSGMGKFPNLENPTTYNEKLQWLKLNDIHEEYSLLVDKYEAKIIVSKRIGDKYIIPTIGVYNSFDEIDINQLPDQFVLKTTHDSGGVVVCTDKTKFDIKAARKKLEKSLRKNYFYEHREFPYKNVKPRIIAEQYMVDESGSELKDYKFFCFDGIPKMLLIVSGRGKDQRQDFYDMDFNLLPVYRKEHPNSGIIRKKPVNWGKMKDIAKNLSSGIPHVRVDLYHICGRILFGELTFYSGSGNIPFIPQEWDYKIGEWLKLPTS